MKKVAGKLRIQLATFRELASFMQFGSDLDADTYMQIEKGRRLTEMLKQKNTNPIPFYKQVVLIYAGVNDYLNPIPLDKIAEFEKNLYLKLDTTHKEISDYIKKTQDLDDTVEKAMKKLIKEVRKELIGNEEDFVDNIS